MAIQYWGASGINGLAKTKQLKSVPEAVKKVFNDTHADMEVRNMLGESLVYTDSSKDALDFLVRNITTTFSTVANLQNLGVLANLSRVILKICYSEIKQKQNSILHPY